MLFPVPHIPEMNTKQLVCYFWDCWTLAQVVFRRVCRSRCWTYRSTDSPSRLWGHSVGLHPATTAASWCRSPTAAPASSPSPAWSHCHSQSSSLKNPPKNGPHRMGLHSGHDAYGDDRERQCKHQIWEIYYELKTQMGASYQSNIDKLKKQSKVKKTQNKTMHNKLEQCN